MDYNNFIYNTEKILLWEVPSNEFSHSCETDVSLVFIKDLITKETFCISFDHQDQPQIIDKKSFINDLNKIEKKWVVNKKEFLHLLPNVNNLFDINLYTHLEFGKSIIDKQLLETQAHKFIYSKNYHNDNKIIPLLKHKEVFEKICDEFFKFDFGIIDDGYKKENETVIETLKEIESNGIYVNSKCFQRHFNDEVIPNKNGLVYSSYNFLTSTGRPSNHFGGINYAALNKEDGCRKCFVSRYGEEEGMMILIDYSASHPRIICNLIDFNIKEDIYSYLGKMYFNREINEYDIDEIKKITFRQIYGGIEEKYKDIKYFNDMKKFINDNWIEFEKKGYILTPLFKRKITTKHLTDPNPLKLFNYILQATETEIGLTAINQVNKYLRNKLSKAVLYTYDSLLLDFYKKDGMETLKEIIKIMKINDKFPVKVYCGKSYGQLRQIYQ